MKVYCTIQQLIRVQGYASLSSIAKCSGFSQKTVLEVLDRNIRLIQRKGSRITGAFLEDVHPAIAEARASGKVFWQENINFGRATSLEWKNNLEADKLRKPYCCGGFGDSYMIQVVLDTPENRAALEALGMSDKVNPKDCTSYLRWNEDGTC